MIFTNLLFALLIGVTPIQTSFNENPLNIETTTDSSSSKCTFNDGKISIKFPGDFKVTTVEKEDFTTKKALHKADDGTVYYLAWSLHKIALNDAQGLCESSTNSFVESIDGELQSSSAIKYKKHKGKGAIISFMEGQINYKVLIIGQNQIQIVVASDTRDISKEAAKFFKSFKYKK